MKKSSPSLLFCVLMDVIGYASYSVPVMGEFADIVWAPLSAFIFYKTFGGRTGVLGGIFNFIEEISPGLDFIPSFTIAWALQRKKQVNPSGNLSFPQRQRSGFFK